MGWVRWVVHRLIQEVEKDMAVSTFDQDGVEVIGYNPLPWTTEKNKTWNSSFQLLNSRHNRTVIREKKGTNKVSMMTAPADWRGRASRRQHRERECSGRLAVSLSWGDQTGSPRQKDCREEHKKGEPHRGAPEICRGVPRVFSWVLTDKWMCVKKLPEPGERTTKQIRENNPCVSGQE